MNILVSYRGAPNIRNWETGAMLADGFEALGNKVFHYGNIYQSASSIKLDQDIPNEIDLLCYCEMNDPERQYTELKNIKAKRKIGWFFDSEMIKDRYRGLVDYFKFDHVFLANPDIINYFQNLDYINISYLPYAACDKRHYRSLDFPKKHDFVLAGSDRPERQRLISALKAEGLDAHLITNIFREQYIDALASAKVVINDEAGGGSDLLAMRWAEAQMAGSRVLTPLGPLDQNLKAGLIDSSMSCDYNSMEDIVVYAKNWLDKMPSQEDHDNFIKNHSYKNRAQKILEVCNLAK